MPTRFPLILLLLLFAPPAWASGGDSSQSDEGFGEYVKPSFLLFGDLYSIPSNHLEEYDGESGWWSRRVYATLDFARFGLGDAVARLRLEANQSDEPGSTDYEYTTKDAYIELRPSGHKITLGRSPTITYDVIEKHWGYRWFEKTPMDIQGAASRVDGVTASGSLGGDGRHRYRAAVGEAKQAGFDSDNVVNAQVALGFAPNEQWLFDLYVDYLDESDFDQRANTYQLFAGWTGETSRAGLQWSLRDFRHRDDEINLLSGYYVHELGRIAAVGRFDRLFDPSVKGNGIAYLPFDPTSEATLLMAGIDIALHENVHLMPNVKYVYYDRNTSGERPEDDVYLKLTVFVELP